MANQPFFSIVIPTKNRPELLRDAIRSALWQNFDDFEVIVSDNFNEQPTLDVIAEFDSNPKFRSVRTDRELKMIDHWEFASKHAAGEYVILLTDRKVLYQNSLSSIKTILLDNHDVNCWSFGVNMFDETNGTLLSDEPRSNEVIWYSSEDLIENFVNVNYYQRKSLDGRFPKTLNGGFKSSYADEIRSKTGSYFNNKDVTTPDYSSFFINAAMNERLPFLDVNCILSQGESVSNGRNFGMGKFQAYMDSLEIDDPYKHVKIEAPFIYALIYSDYRVVSELSKTKALENLANFFAVCQYEMNRKIAQNQIDPKAQEFFENAIKVGRENLSETENRLSMELWAKYEKAKLEWDQGPKKKGIIDYFSAVKRRISKPKSFNSIMKAAKFEQ